VLQWVFLGVAVGVAVGVAECIPALLRQ